MDDPKNLSFSQKNLSFSQKNGFNFYMKVSEPLQPWNPLKSLIKKDPAGFGTSFALIRGPQLGSAPS